MFRFVLTALILLIASVAFGQQTSITGEKFLAAYSAANEKAATFSRIYMSEQVRFSDGIEISRMTWKWEYENPFRSRMLFEQKKPEGTARFEMVNLEDKNYCNIDNGGWIEIAGVCSVRLPWSMKQITRMMDANATSEFSVEQVELAGQKLQRYREYGKRGTWTLPSGAKASPSFYESVFWVDTFGRITRQEFKHTVTEPKRVIETWVDTFDYASKVTVSAPTR